MSRDAENVSSTQSEEDRRGLQAMEGTFHPPSQQTLRRPGTCIPTCYIRTSSHLTKQEARILAGAQWGSWRAGSVRPTVPTLGLEFQEATISWNKDVTEQRGPLWGPAALSPSSTKERSREGHIKTRRTEVSRGWCVTQAVI